MATLHLDRNGVSFPTVQTIIVGSASIGYELMNEG